MESVDTFGIKAHLYYTIGESLPSSMEEDLFDTGDKFSKATFIVNTPG